VRTRLACAAAALTATWLACGGPTNEPRFDHGLGDGPHPWSSESFAAAEGDFTFAIIGDLTGGERPGIFEIGARQLALLRPEIILSIGDLIEGASEDSAALHAEWDSFDERAALAGAPLFRVGGNHDATAQPLRDVWNERYGPLHYHFVYRDVLFLVIDTEDHTDEFRERIRSARNEAVALLNAGETQRYQESEYFRMPERQTGAIGPDQAAYFERVIAEHPDVRWTMLFMHKPIWNAAVETGFDRIEAALADRAFSVFAGHYHMFSHEIRNGRAYTQLATTGGSQSASSDRAFDHVTLVSMTDEGPSVAHVKLDGILDATGHIPADGDSVCFQASRCGRGY
jgi:hypothetical protein